MSEKRLSLSPARFLSARRRHRSAGLVVLLFGLLAVGSAYAAFAPDNAVADTSAQSQQIEEGKKLFAVGCASCHGLNAEGGGNGEGKLAGPSLIGVGAAAVDFQVGTGRMPAQQPGAQIPQKPVTYSEAEIEAMAAYVASLSPGPAVPAEESYDVSKATDEQVTRGGELFRTNCTACHNFAGKGGALPNGRYAPSLMDSSGKHIYEAMLTGPQQMPVFSDQVLQPEDKRDIIAYITALREQKDPGGFGLGRLGPFSEGLWGWLVGIGLLVCAAVWIGAKGVKAKGAKA
ncbi:cytochrome c class I [Kribbella flavida DSM 17836]|uniref:Cytochrome bc1 complex cytochrome c subunit n=1 Tax=Kribbella flavida (strain DSM 17836 / JCM 10339 / NBRC 14399) TaxID=479435 RepID=D2PZ59_KRIFD|nr:cytochrome c [Kribbella flavida]ADB31853.1 cytochrome c class I [Kribbella flavida DSM 17836]